MPARQLWLPSSTHSGESAADPRAETLSTSTQRDEWTELAELYLSWDPDEPEGRKRRLAFLRDLSPADVRCVEYALARLGHGWRAQPDTWAERLTQGRYRPSPLRNFLGRQFRLAATGEEPRQIWTLPARAGKSLMASQHGPAWLLDMEPRSNLILTSYGDDLADENARLVRDLLREHHGEVQARISRDRDRADRWVTEQGGGLLSAGIGSAIAGFGAGANGVLWVGGGVILDDPFKNWQEAHSPARRDAVWRFYLSVLRLRLNLEAAFILIVTTRWHEDDVVARLDKAGLNGDGDEFKLVKLPSLAVADDPLGRAPGEPLDPERFPREAVLARHRALGAYLTAAMEQQEPSPEEGGEFKRAWFRWYDEAPPRFDQLVTSWDMKLKDKETGDYVVGQAWGRVGADVYLLDQLRGQWNFATTQIAIALMSVRHPDIKAHYVENTGNGPEVIEALRKPRPSYTVDDEIAGALGITTCDEHEPGAPCCERGLVERAVRRGVPGIIPVTPKGPKPVRARAHSGIIEAGNTWLPEAHVNGFAMTYVNEMAMFPNGDHDDTVDAWSQAMTKLLRALASTSSAAKRRL